MSLRLSIVDLGTVPPGGTEADALADSLATARDADAAGYDRIWFAEHHLSRSGASHHPELLIAAAAVQTGGIRLGSGAVLMNHYSPFKVAEMFQQLDAMAPGRIDLGMGRATSGPVIDMALQRDRTTRQHADHAQQVLETLAWLYEGFPEDHPFAGHPLMPTVATRPEAWLLGSSPDGSNLAAALGIAYCFAGFINPHAAAAALRNYRTNFLPRGYGWEAPRAMLGVNVTVGETEEEAQHLVNSVKGFYSRLARMTRESGPPIVPAPEVGWGEMTDAERAEPTRIVDGRWPRFVAGDPEQVRATIEQMAEESGADEIIVQDMIADGADRRRSHRLLAEVFDLTPRAPRTAAPATNS